MSTVLHNTEMALAKQLFKDAGGDMNYANSFGGNIFWIMFMGQMGY